MVMTPNLDMAVVLSVSGRHIAFSCITGVL